MLRFPKSVQRGIVIENAVTRAFTEAIGEFHEKWRCCERISPFAIMPDHLHLMFKIRATPDRMALGVLVSQLAKALRKAYWLAVAADAATCKNLPQNALAGGADIAGTADGIGNPSAGGGAQGFAGGASAPPHKRPIPHIQHRNS